MAKKCTYSDCNGGCTWTDAEWRCIINPAHCQYKNISIRAHLVEIPEEPEQPIDFDGLSEVFGGT